MTNSTISQKELFNTLSAFEFAAYFLSTSNKPSDVQKMEGILGKLHKYRAKYPQYESAICHTLFNIFDHSYYNSPEYMRSKVQVGIIYGFLNPPTDKMQVLTQLIDRVALIEKPTNMLHAFKTIAEKTINAYKRNNHKEKDDNLKTAFRLKMMIQMIDSCLKRKTRVDSIWLHQNAQKLADIHPNFKEFAKTFPKPNQSKKIQKLLPKEAADAFPAKPSMRRLIFSRFYE